MQTLSKKGIRKTLSVWGASSHTRTKRNISGLLAEACVDHQRSASAFDFPSVLDSLVVHATATKRHFTLPPGTTWEQRISGPWRVVTSVDVILRMNRRRHTIVRSLAVLHTIGRAVVQWLPTEQRVNRSNLVPTSSPSEKGLQCPAAFE